MAFSLLPQFFFISILSTIICITNFTHAYNLCLDDQKNLLLELKNDLIFNSSISRKLVHWNPTEDCCNWEGVGCDGEGHVISLQLDEEGISGGLENSSSLFSLRYLKKLNLALNDFNSTRIPRGIGNLTYLTHLNLSVAGFGGQVPIELSLLTKLVSLDISGDWLYSQPLELKHPNLKMLIQNLTGLRELYLHHVDISAQGSEWCQVISSSLPDLRILSLCYCNLLGPLDPSLLQLHSLSVLQLDGNDLSTAVPDFFANFSSLTDLSLSDCSLKGSFPELIFQVLTLQNLDLSDNELLSGTIPQFPQGGSLRSIVLGRTNFSGPLTDSVSNLRMLSQLDLFDCKFTGTIPSTMTNLTELTYVDLSRNFFTGKIPLFYKSKKLTYIGLSRNSLTGSLSSMHLEDLPNLVSIDLEYNLLNGSIPQSLFCLPSLQSLRLSGNQFSGQVDEFSTLNFSNILELDLSSNQLEGPIPDSFFELQSLQNLYLGDNFFNGTFQMEKIQRLRNLSSLFLSYNKLSVNLSFPTFPQLYSLGLASCNFHSFPDLTNQSYLGYLDLSNNQIAGEIPSWTWELGNGTLSYLNLSSNLLVDLQKPHRIPRSLLYLDLHSNLLQGELPNIPPTTRNSNSVLQFFSLANNSFSGAIPTSLCNAIELEILDLSFNNLSGVIPPCLVENLENLVVFKLGRNKISGHIPDAFSISCSLNTLDLNNNNLRGNIPMSLRNCKTLAVMNVGYNNIDDSFPCMLSSSLRVLILRFNRFCGEVRCHKSWPNLQIIDIASNNLSGHLYPINFSKWRGMMLESDAQSRHNHSSFDFLQAGDYYRDEVTLTIKGIELTLVKIWPDFTSIDFSCNNFQGEIPEALGDLGSLYLLNLSHNTLIGNIPKSLGKLRQLESLDLSVNLLKGTIPVELAGLTFLPLLNLSYNKLVGKIPSGPQFLTFSAASFEGNTGLCGFPLNISCDTDEVVVSPPKLEHVKIEWDYVSAALGYVVGLGSFVWLLLCCQNLRRKYFGKVDEVLEKIFNRQDRKRRQGRRRVVRNQARRQ